MSGPDRLPLVSVAIVTMNRRADIVDTLDGLLALDYPGESLEVLVLDNGSGDGTDVAARAWLSEKGERAFARAELFRSPDNRGLSWARNFLAGQASPRSEFVFILDDDAIPEAGVITALVRAARQDPRAGMVGPKIVAADDPARCLAAAGFVDWRLGRFWGAEPAYTMPCDFVIGCAALIRRQAFTATGGWDEDFFIYHEDVDFCVRVQGQGFRVLYEPSVAVHHKVPPGKTRSPRRLYYIVRNKLLFIRKHAPWRRRRLPSLVFWLGTVPRMLVESLAVHRGIDRVEMGTILGALRDAVAGRTGERPR